MRMQAMSNGSKCPLAEARAMTINAVQISTVMTAASAPYGARRQLAQAV
jgi:hypothetical protein